RGHWRRCRKGRRNRSRSWGGRRRDAPQTGRAETNGRSRESETGLQRRGRWIQTGLFHLHDGTRIHRELIEQRQCDPVYLSTGKRIEAALTLSDLGMV